MSSDRERNRHHLSELPDSWVWASLDEILLNIEAGKSFKCDERYPSENEVGVLKVSAVTWRKFDEFASKTCLDIDAINPCFFVKTGDFLFSRANTIELVGACVIVNHTQRRLMLSDKTLRLQFSTKVCPEWILYMLRTRHGRNEIESLATGNQESMRNISQSNIRRIRIPLPPLAEQKRIVEKIEELFTQLDAGVELLKKLKLKLKRYRQAVLKAAVEGKLTQTWREAHQSELEPASVLLERILKERREKWETDQLAQMQAKGKPPKDDSWKKKYKEPSPTATSGLPKLPEKWIWTRVDQIGEVQLGRQRSPKNRSKDYPTKYIRAANITEDGLDLTSILDMEFKPQEFERYQLKFGDIILSEASGSADQAGKPAIWRDQIKNCCFQNTVIRLSSMGLSNEYLLAVFKSFYSNGIFAKLATGVGINHLSANKFASIPVPIAPLYEQNQIVMEIERCLSIVSKLETLVEVNLRRAEKLRQSILKQAFEGKLVPQDPTDEPAEQLLERIKAEKAKREAEQKVQRQSQPKKGRKANPIETLAAQGEEARS